MAAGTAPTELGSKKISTLLKQYAVPGIIAMTASSLYNMVDSMFIGHIPETGSLAISGIGVAFPLMNISSALGTLVGVGAATMISVLLGQKNYKTANKVLANEVTLNIIVGLLFTLFTVPFLGPIMRFFGASDNTLPYAYSYMLIISLGNVITHLYFGLNSVIRSSGNPKLAMNLTLFTVISNSILDPIFIFVLKLGAQGAAIATVLCQTMALAFTLKYFLNKKRFLHLEKKDFMFLDLRIAKDSLSIGMGPFLMNLASCIVVLFINRQLLFYGGDLAIGAYGIVHRISFFFVMIIMGFNQGMQPIAGYNYGARKYSRVRLVYLRTMAYATIICTCGWIVSMFFPDLAVRLFSNDPELIAIADKGLRNLNLLFPVVGFQMVTTNLFQCLGMVNKSIFLSLSRQLIFLVPSIYFLPRFIGELGVWLSYPISDGIASVVTALFAISLLRKLHRLKDGDDPSILGSRI